MMREIMTTADRKSPNGQLAPRWVVVHFDAWKNERRSPPWWPLMEAVKTECLARLSASKIGWLRVCGGLLDPDDQAARLEGRWLWWKIKTDALPYVIAAVCGIVCLWLLWFAGSTPDGRICDLRMASANSLLLPLPHMRHSLGLTASPFSEARTAQSFTRTFLKIRSSE